MEFGLVNINGFHPLLDGNSNNDIHGSGFIKQEGSDPFHPNRVDDNKHQQTLTFSLNNQPPCYGGGNEGKYGCLEGIRGTFTPAQWIELEHQAMVYKYLTANVPVPSNLLIPIKKAIQSSAFPAFSFGSYASPSYGWGAFHLGFSGNTDPEPGRCRRTDGKKWRCSKETVPDQKYCERHINRGRHRSRKPVEGQSGQATSGTATTKMVPPTSTSMSMSVAPGGGSSNGSVIAHHQIKGFLPTGATNVSADPIAKRRNDQQGISMMPPTINPESTDSQYSIRKSHISYNESAISDFGIVSNDALLNPSASYLEGKTYDSLLEFNTQQNQNQYQLRHFMDHWPEDQSHQKSEGTHLSTSIPVSTDFSLSNQVSHELESTQMGLDETFIGEAGTNKKNVWVPVARGNSMGGPLGEVLLTNASPIVS